MLQKEESDFVRYPYSETTAINYPVGRSRIVFSRGMHLLD